MKSMLMTFLLFTMLPVSSWAELTTAQRQDVRICNERALGFKTRCATLADLSDMSKRRELFALNVEAQESLEALLNYLNSDTFEVQFKRLELKSGDAGFNIEFATDRMVNLRNKATYMAPSVRCKIRAGGLREVERITSMGANYPVVGFNELVNETLNSLAANPLRDNFGKPAKSELAPLTKAETE